MYVNKKKILLDIWNHIFFCSEKKYIDNGNTNYDDLFN